MIGKILLGVLWTVLGLFGLLLLLILLLSLIPAHIFVDYEAGELSLRVSYGPVKRVLYPVEKTEEAKKKPKKPRKSKKAKSDQQKEQEGSVKKKRSLNLDQILCCLEDLPPILGRALRRVGRRIRVQPFFLHVLVAGQDPAATATLYGRLTAALWAFCPAVARVVHVRDADVRLFVDFRRAQPDCIAHVGVSLRLWDLLVTAVCAGASGLKWLLRFRRLASPPQAEEKKETSAPPKAGAPGGGEDNSAA